MVEKSVRQVNFLIKKLCSINNANEPKAPRDRDRICLVLTFHLLFISVHPLTGNTSSRTHSVKQSFEDYLCSCSGELKLST